MRNYRLLVITKNRTAQKFFWRTFSPYININFYQAETVEKAKNLLAENHFKAIAVDCFFRNKSDPAIVELVRQIRKRFKGLILAMSASESANKELINAGCSEATIYKSEVPGRLIREL